MQLRDLEALEAKITKAKDERSRAQGSLDQIRSQAKAEFGVETLEDAKAKEAELTQQAADLSRKLDDEFTQLQADVATAVAG